MSWKAGLCDKRDVEEQISVPPRRVHGRYNQYCPCFCEGVTSRKLAGLDGCPVSQVKTQHPHGVPTRKEKSTVKLGC